MMRLFSTTPLRVAVVVSTSWAELETVTDSRYGADIETNVYAGLLLRCDRISLDHETAESGLFRFYAISAGRYRADEIEAGFV